MNKANVQVIHSKGCKECDRVMSLLSQLSEDFPGQVEVSCFDVESEDACELALRHDLDDVPSIVINGMVVEKHPDIEALSRAMGFRNG